jgi:hypothetical protein
LLQAFDVVVVNDASSLCCRPLQNERHRPIYLLSSRWDIGSPRRCWAGLRVVMS